MCLECHVSLASDTGGDVDGLALGQRHDSLIHVGPRVGTTLPTLGLALLGKRVDARHLAAEPGFTSRLALRFGGVASDLEDNLIMLGGQGRHLGVVWGETHTQMV